MTSNNPHLCWSNQSASLKTTCWPNAVGMSEPVQSKQCSVKKCHNQNTSYLPLHSKVQGLPLTCHHCGRPGHLAIMYTVTKENCGKIGHLQQSTDKNRLQKQTSKWIKWQMRRHMTKCNSGAQNGWRHQDVCGHAQSQWGCGAWKTPHSHHRYWRTWLEPKCSPNWT